MLKPKLLLADDSITIQKVVNLTFADQGMDVFAFPDGDKAIEMFDEIDPDVVLADVNMPGINGYQLCELLRGDPKHRDVPIVLLVGSFEPFDQDEADRVGADTHLTKPFSSIADLVSTVEGLLKKRQNGTSAVPSEEEGEVPADSSNTSDAQAAGQPRPDTTDIDRLYEQSFMETVEIPQEQTFDIEYEEVDIDDEMIQTSYAHAGDAPLVDAPMYEGEDLSAESGGLDPSEMDTAETIDFAEADVPSSYEFEPAEPETPAEQPVSVEQADDSAGPDPSTANAAPSEQEEPAPAAQDRDPFASIADEPPPIEYENGSSNAVRFTFDEMDLLELPDAPPARSVWNTQPAVREPAATDTLGLTPEQIDLIVEKVLERMEQRKLI